MTWDLFGIVYGDLVWKETAESFRDRLAEKTGVMLTVSRDVAESPAAHEILLGDTNRDESKAVEEQGILHYAAAVKNGKLVLKAGGEHSMWLQLDRVMAELTAENGEIGLQEGTLWEENLCHDPCLKPMPENADIRVVSANVLAQLDTYGAPEGYPFGRRVEIFYGMLEYYEPTVVGLQEFCKFWMADFRQYRYRDRWGLLEFDNVRREGEKVLSTVLYRKDLCTLVDSGMHYYSVHNNGRCRCYTWALLKIKATEKEFCFVSTHWDGHKSPNTMQQVAEITEFVREMSKRCPVITTGDFNTGEREEAMIQYLRDIDSADAMHESDERLNVQGSWHDWAKDYSSYNSIDHITVTRPSRSLQFETLYYNEQIYASDHAWLLADVLLRK